MNKGFARPLTPEEFEQGYAICDCGKYAHVFRASTLSRLPKGYNGELCSECSCLMVAVEMLMPTTELNEIAKEYFPDKDDVFLDYVIWNETGFPSFWYIPEDGNTPEECFRKQLKEYADKIKST